MQGTILHLQKMSTEDGPGIRTTVFFKGCGLHCAWCHNPESISFNPEIQWFASRCLNCRSCIASCPENCLSMTDQDLQIDRSSCTGCFQCAAACPADAIEALGKRITVPELMAELRKDLAYYQASGGGVTLSGGEPSMQADFCEELLRTLKQEGISTALDTCGICTPVALQRLLPHVNLILFDLKIMDEALHKKFTGVVNTQILNNLKLLAGTLKTQTNPPELWIRTPLIPGATANEENLTAIGLFLQHNLPGLVTRWELCAFNNLCRDQYKRLNIAWDYAEQNLMSSEEVEHWGEVARNSGISSEIVITSGATRVEVLAC
jgi:pyruvate formate lyase activating enzyme